MADCRDSLSLSLSLSLSSSLARSLARSLSLSLSLCLLLSTHVETYVVNVIVAKPTLQSFLCCILWVSDLFVVELPLLPSEYIAAKQNPNTERAIYLKSAHRTNC